MSNNVHPPVGEQPEGNLDALGKLENAMKNLFANMDRLQENLKKLTEENERLKELLNITTTEEPLILTKDMEVKDGHQ
jgi:cell shape-determining protein MreC|tara:strand:- start:245 stop:478 length:234 start_codon:yes stop_codon:yes gene_type:complete